MKLFFKTSSNYEHEYQIAVGSTISECLNEELDSATVILVQVPSEHRLINITPYDECVIYDEDKSHVWYFFLNQYEEKELNIAKHIYQYTIELFSETKLLEKIQLPNRQFVHSNITAAGVVVYQSQKTIGEVICELLKLYIPKVKFTSSGTGWSYSPIISWNEATIKAYFPQPLKDCSMSQPTLRQALTTVMSQAGCLPRISHRTFTWLDFNAPSSDFVVHSGQNYVERSNSAGSYVNRLVNMGENILDQDNVVVDEILTFRDKTNALLKQRENLVLNCQYPIYNVRKLIINTTLKQDTQIHSTVNGGKSVVTIPGVEGLKVSINHNTDLGEGNWYDDGIKSLVLVVDSSGYTANAQWSLFTKLTNFKFLFKHIDENGIMSVDEYIYDFGTITKDEMIGNPGGWFFYKQIDFPSDFDTSRWNIVIFSFDINNGTTQYYGFDGDSDLISSSSQPPTLDTWITIKNIAFIHYSKDITAICLESEKRNYLSRDFREIQGTNPTISEMSQYYYGTVQYTIRGNIIEGFSSNFTGIVSWFGSATVTVFDLIKGGGGWTTTSFTTADKKAIISEMVDIRVKDLIITAVLSGNLTPNAGDYYFSIEYEALNALRSHHEKEVDIPLPIEQMDSQESAITDFGSMALAEQDKINRLGEDVIMISQRAFSIAEINEVNSVFDNDYTVFKRTVSVNHNHFDVNYIASKNYVIKNYSTAIQTKYRAYAYVDISQAVERKENKTVYIYISKYGYNGDKEILLDKYNLTDFIRPVNTRSLSYGYTEDSDEFFAFKNQMQVLTSTNKLIIGQKELTNSQGALYLGNDGIPELGGIPQFWKSYDENYYNEHTIGFTSSFYVPIASFENTIYNNSFKKTLLENEYKLILCDDNDSIDGIYTRTYYKDWSELINQTIQFVYVWDEGFKASDNFANHVAFVNRNTDYLYGVVYDNGDIIKGERIINVMPEPLNTLISYGSSSITFKNLSSYSNAKIVKYEQASSRTERADINSSYVNPTPITVNFKPEPDPYYEYHGIKTIDVSPREAISLMSASIISVNILNARTDSYSLSGNVITINFTVYSSSPISIARRDLLITWGVSYTYRTYSINAIDLLYVDCGIVSGKTYHVNLNDTRTHKVYSVDTESGLLVLNYELNTSGTLFKN